MRSLSHLPFDILPTAIGNILSAIFDDIVEDVDQRDKVRIRLDSTHLRYPILTPPIQRDQVTVERLMVEVAQILQSGDEFKLDDTFTIWLQHAAVPGGACFVADKCGKPIALRNYH